MYNILMKQLMLATLFVACCVESFQAHAQSPYAHTYFTTKDMPDMVKFLPAPSKFGTEFFANDSVWYEWGKRMRGCKVRADIAKRDAVYGLNTIIREFSRI